MAPYLIRVSHCWSRFSYSGFRSPWLPNQPVHYDILGIKLVMRSYMKKFTCVLGKKFIRGEAKGKSMGRKKNF